MWSCQTACWIFIAKLQGLAGANAPAFPGIPANCLLFIAACSYRFSVNCETNDQSPTHYSAF